MSLISQNISSKGLAVACLWPVIASAADEAKLAVEYKKEILPVFVNYCYDCHGDGVKKGHLALDHYESIPEMIADRGQWQKIRDHIDFRLMPPPDEYAPEDEERAKLVRWIDDAVFPVDPENPDPGHVTLRRLNRNEYQNTIRDLLGVEINVNEILPVDDSGYGFDNIGDVLTLSPLHMEKYLEAARVVLDKAIDFSAPKFPQIEIGGTELEGGGKNSGTIKLMLNNAEAAAYRQLGAEGKNDRNLYIEKVILEGPINGSPLRKKESHYLIFGKGQGGLSESAYMLAVIRNFARKAFRRPLKDGEAERYLIFLKMAKAEGEPMKYAIRQALSAVLVSPSFLFREELTVATKLGGKAMIDEHALASRLSYFLWSSMPDARLLDLADKGELRKNLRSEIKRMAESEKSQAFVGNFVGQWLQLRDMEAITTDQKVFAGFDGRMAQDMRTETEMLVKYIMHDNLPIKLLLDADFTFINERLAKHYDIKGVTGDDFRKVSLVGTPRRGLLGQGSILTLTSHSTDPPRRSGSCDSGYSCAYQYNLSWRSESTPAPAERDPRMVFEKLFGSGNAKQDALRRTKQKSILDFVMNDAKRFNSRLDSADQGKMDEYLTAVRDIEGRIENAENFRIEVPEDERPNGVPDTYQEHIRMMYEMMALGFQTDATRIATFLLAHDGSGRNFPEIGVSGGHHELSHHRGNQKSLEQLAAIDCFYAEQFAWFLEKLRKTPDGDGNLLDNSMILYGGGIQNGDRHNHNDLPVILAGHGGGIKQGRVITADEGTPMTNLYLSLMDRMGAKAERVGDSNGKFERIS